MQLRQEKNVDIRGNFMMAPKWNNADTLHQQGNE